MWGTGNRRAFRKAPRRALLVAVLVLLSLGGVAIAQSVTSGEVGPSLHLTGNGHRLHPAGRLTSVGNFPDGSALVPGGRFLWVADCGHGEDDIKVVDLVTGKVIQTLPLPGCYGGVAIAPDGHAAYVSGDPKGSSPTEGPTKGDQGDVIHIFTVNSATGKGIEQNPLQLASTGSGGDGRVDSLPPSEGVGSAQPEGLAVSPDGRHLVVALNAADDAVVVDLPSMSQHVVSVGQYPEGVVFDPQGRAYVSNEYSGTVSVIDPASAKVTGTITGLGGSLGDLASHPEGMAADPHRPALYVAVTNRDLVAVVDTATASVTHLISVARPQGLGTAPTSVAVSPDGATLYSSDAGEDAIAAISLSKRPGRLHAHRVYSPPTLAAIRAYRRTHRARLLHPRSSKACSGPTAAQERRYVQRVLTALRGAARHRGARIKAAHAALPAIGRCRSGYIPNLPADQLIGRIPTAAYPDSVQTTPHGQLVWVAGKGFGSGPNPTYNFGGAKTPYQTPPDKQYGTYVLDMFVGKVGRLGLPSDRTVVADTAAANSQSRPYDTESQPAGSPIPAVTGHPSAQIKHVFYIVRENRTYDQIFGSDPRGDGNKGLELFDNDGVSGPAGGITPNAHSLVQRFPLIDHFYEDSEVSVDGHLITTGAYATDYVQKATAANYANRRGTYDFGIFPVTFPPKFFIFDQAVKQNVSFMDYGEAVGATGPGNAPNRTAFTQVQQHVFAPYPNNLLIGCLQAGVKASCTQDSGLYKGTGTIFAGQSRFNEWYPEFQSQVVSGTVPAFNYLILPDDHTNGTTPGDTTPQAMIADNDLALGQMVDAISHSSIWPSTAIFVVEDDSQDGADHVDSHRSPAFVISPWARQGAVVGTRYDQYSMLRTVELILGLDPLALDDALATPMYDAFISGSEKPNDAPYNVVAPSYSISTMNSAKAADAQLSKQLPWNRLDAVPQAISDEILWASVHGPHSTPPPAGPNASPDEVDRAAMMRYLLREAHQSPASEVARAWRHAGSKCPITWACKPPPPGEP
jgi:YVTN family beta-propeller protein